MVKVEADEAWTNHRVRMTVRFRSPAKDVSCSYEAWRAIVAFLDVVAGARVRQTPILIG